MDEVPWKTRLSGKEAGKIFFFEVGVFQDFQDFRKLAGDFRGTSKTEDMVNL
jgi:hypothetical protein